MKVIRPELFAVAALLAAPIATPAVAGTDYEIEVTDHKRSKVGVDRFQVEGADVRVELAPRSRKDRGGVLIYRGERATPRLLVADGQGGHVVVDQAAIERLAAEAPQRDAPEMSAAMIENARAQAESIADPESRARALAELDERFGPRGGEAVAEAPGLEYVERGVREKQGYPCVRYDVLRDGVKVQEIWATDWANLEGGRQTGKALEEFGEFYRGLLDSLAPMPGKSAAILGREDNPVETILELGRFPVTADEYENGELVRSSVLKSARKVDHPPGTFKLESSSVERPFGK